jgi:Domain of unknown function (DUF5606)
LHPETILKTMNLSDIISIGGKPGLFKIVAQIKNGVLVESLVDQKRFPAHSTNQVSELNNITVYTEDADITLSAVFQNIFDAEKGKECIDAKSSNDELKAYFKKVLPSYDQDRVYTSDIKKILNWYNILQKKGLLVPAKEEKKETKAEKETTAETKVAKPKAAAKTAKPKEAKTTAAKTSSAKIKVQTVRKAGI